MKKSSLHILRVGTAITFLWIGILIIQSPEAWGGLLLPWAVKLLPISIKTAMLETAVLDLLIGALLLFDVLVPWAALLGALHMLTVLSVSGINEATVRDIAILAGTLALFWESRPEWLIEKFKRRAPQTLP